MALLVFFVFIIVPIAELYVIIQVGGAIGVPQTIALLILDSIFGAWLLRHQGRGAWVRFQTALGEGRQPGREVLDGVLIVFGGAFLITPGFLSDIIGILLLVPPTRALFRGLLVRMAVKRATFGLYSPGKGFRFEPGRGSDPRGSTPPRRPPSSGDVVEGSAVEIDDTPPSLPRP